MLRAFDASASLWDDDLDASGAWAPHNYSGWASLRALDGWKFVRVLTDSGTPLTQVLIKPIGFGACVAYAPGGLITGTTVDADEFVEFLSNHLSAHVRYARIHSSTPRFHKEENVSLAGWQRVSHRLGAASTLVMQLDAPHDNRRDLLSTNWSRNLRRGEQRDNVVELLSETPIEDVVSAHESVRDVKGVDVASWALSREHLRALSEGFGNRLVIARCTDPIGNLRAIRAAIITGGCAFDIIAATTMEGRKQYSSHLTLWRLAEELGRRGVACYDLGGVDENQNRGVYDFKRGTGAEPVEYGDELDFASPHFLRGVAGRVVTLRMT